MVRTRLLAYRLGPANIQLVMFCLSFSITWSMVNDAGRWLGGNSLKLCRNLATPAYAP